MAPHPTYVVIKWDDPGRLSSRKVVYAGGKQRLAREIAEENVEYNESCSEVQVWSDGELKSRVKYFGRWQDDTIRERQLEP